MRLGLLAITVAGCFRPTAATGVPCASNGDCPSGQHCDPGTTTCVTMASTDATLAIDAPPIDGTTASCASGCPDTTAPICDHGVCRGCVADAECQSDVCVEFQGRCADEPEVVYVTQSGSNQNTGSRGQPCKLSNAPNRLEATRNIIKLTDGTYSTQVHLPALAGTTFIVSGENLDPAGASVSSANGATVLVDGTAVLEGFGITAPSGDAIKTTGDLTTYRMDLHDTSTAGINAGGTVRLRDTTIRNSTLHGIYMPGGGTLDLERCRLINNTGGGLTATGALVTATSSILADNGVATAANGAVTLSGALDGTRFSFVTVANNLTTAGSIGGIASDVAVPIDNSIFFASGTPMCATCTASYTMFDTDPPAGPGNFNGDPMFKGVADYHLMPGSDARGKAEVLAMPPPDIDGQARSTTAADVGADEIP